MFLSNTTVWNVPGLTIILLSLNQLITTSGSDCKVFFNFATFFVMADKEFH